MLKYAKAKPFMLVSLIFSRNRAGDVLDAAPCTCRVDRLLQQIPEELNHYGQ